MEFLVRLLDDPDAGAVRALRQLHGTWPAADRRRRAGPGRGLVPAPRPANDPAPRCMWPADAVAGPLRARSRHRTSRAWRSASTAMRDGAATSSAGKYVDGAVQSVSSSRRPRKAIRDRWHPTPPPDVGHRIAIHGGTRPGRRVRAVAGRSPRPTLRRVRSSVLEGAEPQKAMQNSAQQLRNAHAKLGIDGAAVLPGPVLLVDDIVDSGWTLTVAGWLLRSHGSGEVHPFALAVASGAGRLTDDRRRARSPPMPRRSSCSARVSGAPSGSGRPFGPVDMGEARRTRSRRQSFRGPRDLIGLAARRDRSIDRCRGSRGRLGSRDLLGSSGQLAFELDRLQSRGVWVVTIADDGYPTRLRERLGSAAPPVLFGSGPAVAPGRRWRRDRRVARGGRGRDGVHGCASRRRLSQAVHRSSPAAPAGST